MFSSSSNGVVPSLSDIAAVTGANNNDGFGGGWGAWIWIIVIFAIFGWGGFNGNGFGGGYGNGTSAVLSTFDTDYIAQGLRDIQSGLAGNFLTLNNENLSGVCDIRGDIASGTASITNSLNTGFAAQTLAAVNNANAIQRDIFANTVANTQNTQAITGTLAQMASDNRSDTAQLQYAQATNTNALQTTACNNARDIIDAINASNRSVLDAMAQNKVEAMQDKIADLQAQLQTANLAASQAAQNQYLTDTLRPLPVPAYQTQNPWSGCNCNMCGCMS